MLSCGSLGTDLRSEELSSFRYKKCMMPSSPRKKAVFKLAAEEINDFVQR